MENIFHCLNCGVKFSKSEAGQAGGHCPECGADLTEITSADNVGEKAPRTGRIVFAVLALLCLGALFFFLRPSEKAMSVDKILAKYREADAKTPMMIDATTRLDQVVVEDKNVTFKTTLVNVSGENTEDDLFKRKIAPFLADKYCNDKSSRKAMKDGVTYGHEISANDGKLLYTVDISLEDC